MTETGFDLAADTLLRSSEGDPNSSPDEDPREAIREFLATPGLTDSPDCVQIGFLGDRPVAFLCAQVEAATGWSRIAYIGVAPEARGQGLGREVHLHGMAMLRHLGGTLYHGGTAADNAPMLALFRSNGCIESSRMQDWEWRG
jgi:ribosomal protein S18 acetylase RimI-like enzyme